ncbi:hypothetical protein DXG01_003752 [Tephrocybe rancida]|nr:hypothetical protein DXG01_003752 [Tephrocybe rancida]
MPVPATSRTATTLVREVVVGEMPPPRTTYAPPADVYRDLLLFEERLKSNAANLKSRKARYQQERAAGVGVHPYFSTGLLFVSVTTLILFFASGMYGEKISYANKYVPHANRALRSFNMYLNVRKPSLRSKLSLNPLAFFFPRPAPSSPPSSAASSSSSTPSATPPPRSRSPPHKATPPINHPQDQNSPVTRTFPTPGAPRSMPIPSIPPASNPRGELIFSSRIDRTFREGYERHRAAFERRREERERERRRADSWFWYLTTWGKRDKEKEKAGVVDAGKAEKGEKTGKGKEREGLEKGIMMRQAKREGSHTPSRNRSPEEVGDRGDRHSRRGTGR